MRQRPYQQLIAWKEAHALCVHTYKITYTFPKHELFGLVSQMRRSSSSIPTNIAEGNSRRTANDQKNFHTIAISSIEELHYQYLLARDLGYITVQQFLEADDRIQRTGYLIGKLRYIFYSLRCIPPHANPSFPHATLPGTAFLILSSYPDCRRCKSGVA
jgi:four helix bundle protein